MIKKILPLFLLLPLSVFSQGQANNWYFGINAGVTFNTSPPSALTNGKLDTSEGCSSISDAAGNLLFYTDGRTIWNSNHQIMPNADYYGGSGLFGDPSSTSSALIVPHPGNPNQYFVFTVDEPHHDNASAYPNQGPGTPNGQYSDTNGYVPQADDGYNRGFNYSVVDMSLRNGLGDVPLGKRNQHLITYDPNDPEQIKYKCSEKITAVKGVDCNSIWVITHFINKFYAFKVDVNGVDPNPIVSTIGPIVPISAYRRAAIGYLKASPNGEKLLVAHLTKTYNPSTGAQGEDGGVYLYDFNTTTGKVSNQVVLAEKLNPYGVEFSPQSTKAYATVEDNGQTLLYQWDLTAANIPASLYAFTNATVTSSALQLAPNGKIYHAFLGSSILAVINHPELKGAAAGYSNSTANGAIALQGRQATFGLPPFIQSIFSESINIVDSSPDIKTRVALCEGETYTLGYDNIPGASYTWFKNGALIPGETSPNLNVSHDPAQSLPYTETYRLEVDLNDGSCPLIGTAQVTFSPKPQLSDVVYEQCQFGTGTLSYFNLEQVKTEIVQGANASSFVFEFYPSLSDAQNDTNKITNTNSYQNTQSPDILVVKATNDSGCFDFAQIELLVVSGTDGFPPIELVACDRDMDGFEDFDLTQVIPQINQGSPNVEITFYTDLQDAYTETNPILDPSRFQAGGQNGTLVFARAELDGDCQGIFQIDLETGAVPPVGEDLTEGNSLVYCVENYPGKITLDSGIPPEDLSNYTFLWMPSNEATPSIKVNKTGEYSVIVTDIASGCTATRNINLIPSSIAVFTLDVGLANTLLVVLSPESIGDYEYSLDDINGPYQDSKLFESIPPGPHMVYARDKRGCGISQELGIVYGIMKFFTPNNDGINDKWTFFLEVDDFKNTRLYIFDRYGKTLHADSGNSQGWNGMYNGKAMPSDDYWYRIIVENPPTGEAGGQVLRGHFSLIR